MKASLPIQIKNRIKNKGRKTRSSVAVWVEVEMKNNLSSLGKLNETLPQFST